MGPLERLSLALTGRTMEVFVPIGLERRLRDQLVRLNAQISEPEDLFDLYEDIDSALVGVALAGLREAEREAGLEYDDFTGEIITTKGDRA